MEVIKEEIKENQEYRNWETAYKNFQLTTGIKYGGDWMTMLNFYLADSPEEGVKVLLLKGIKLDWLKDMNEVRKIWDEGQLEETKRTREYLNN